MLKHYLHFMQYPKDGPAYGAFDYGNSHFIALNTEDVGGPPAPTPTATPEKKLKLDPGFVSPQQLKLLKSDLEANKAKAHIFDVMHHPIKPLKSHPVCMSRTQKCWSRSSRTTRTFLMSSRRTSICITRRPLRR